MERDKAIAIVKRHLTKERFEHTLRVTDTAVKLAEWYDVSITKAELAAIFHDYAKYRPLDEMKRWIKQTKQLPKDLLCYHHELWHGPVASILIEREYGISDMEIKQAIYSHTTGRANMSKLEMVIFVADYIEPGRSFPGVEKVREAAKHDLITAAWMAASNTIQYLMSKHHTVYPDTFYAYNDLTKRMDGVNN